jgi:hypothetical protein
VTGSVRGFPAYSGQSYSSLEKRAAHVRAALLPGYPVHCAVPGLQLFERLDEYQVHARGRPLHLQYGIEELAPGLEAHARYSIDEEAIVVVLTPTTYANLADGVGRALFTFCHEVGHAVLHAAELVDRATAAGQGAALHRGSASAHKALEFPRYGGQPGYAARLLIFSFMNFNSNSIGLA